MNLRPDGGRERPPIGVSDQAYRRARFFHEVDDAFGIERRETLVRNPSLGTCGVSRTHERYLMTMKKLIEVHCLAPRCKRERRGLSVVGAYG